MFSLLRRVAKKFKRKKVGILIKSRQEGHCERETEQGAFPKGNRAGLLEFGYEILR